MARYAGQFVPLKIDTQTEQWQKWAAKYTSEGHGIPIIYVVRADGEQLYGKTGSLPRGELHQLIKAVLQKAGTIFNEKQLQLVETSLEEARRAMDKDETSQAIRQLNRMKNLGELGNFGSYAQVSVEADKFAQDLIHQCKKNLAGASQKLNVAESALDGALILMETQRNFGSLGPVRADIRNTFTNFRKVQTTRHLLKQAEQLENARNLMHQPDHKHHVVTLLRQVTVDHPDTDAAALAVRWIQEKLVSDRDARDLETIYSWASRDNRHTTDASLLGCQRDAQTNEIRKIKLKKQNGKQVQVKYSRLDAVSQELAATILRIRDGSIDP